MSTLTGRRETVAHEVQPIDRPAFEFSAEQEGVFHDLGRKMRFVGAFFLAAGLLRLVYDALVVREVRPDITFLIDVLIGFWTLTAGRAFRQVARTKGGDIGLLMDGLCDLRKLYSLLYWLLIVALILGGVLLLFGITDHEMVYRIR